MSVLRTAGYGFAIVMSFVALVLFAFLPALSLVTSLVYQGF